VLEATFNTCKNKLKVYKIVLLNVNALLWSFTTRIVDYVTGIKFKQVLELS